MTKTEIYLIRHGETIEKTDSMPTDDVPLNTKGREQAEKTGKYLKQYSKIDYIISSQLIRTIETSDIIAEEIGYNRKIERNKNLNEFNWNWDRMKRKRTNELMDPIIEEFENKYKNDPIGYYKNLNKDVINYKIPQNIKSPKSLKHFENRIKDFLNALTKTKHKKIIIIAHHYVINMIISLITGLEMYMTISIKGKGDKPNGNCSITYITLKNSEYNIVGPPSTSHLI